MHRHGAASALPAPTWSAAGPPRAGRHPSAPFCSALGLGPLLRGWRSRHAPAVDAYRRPPCVSSSARAPPAARAAKLEDLFAFSYQPNYDSNVDGWSFYSHEEEYARFGVPSDKWVLSATNSRYELSKSYTAWVYVPASLKPSTVAGSAKFRSKGRLPALSYLYKNKTAICRCAQPMAGVQSKRSQHDELLLQAIWEANPSKKPVKIVDTRPKLNAVANKAKGKGFENMQGYPNAELVFHGIENIHCMRDSLAALLKVVRESDTMKEQLDGLEKCGWLFHIRAILVTTVHIVKYVLAGHSVVIHCSDGWDRTAQTCSLAGFMLEPYYRTIRGFIVLVEKEWLGFGHKMSDRNQFLAGSNNEVSPIFLQFLECTWHISQQYPRAFEFNELFLITMYDCLVSSQFGTYLTNNECDRKEAKLHQKTQSVWSYLYSRHEDFLNPLYDIGEPAHQAYLLPELGLQHYQLWTAMYCRFDADTQPRQTQLGAIARMQLDTKMNEKRLEVLAAKIQAAKDAIEKKKNPAPPPAPEPDAARAKPDDGPAGAEPTDGADGPAVGEGAAEKEPDAPALTDPVAVEVDPLSTPLGTPAKAAPTAGGGGLFDDDDAGEWIGKSPAAAAAEPDKLGGRVLARKRSTVFHSPSGDMVKLAFENMDAAELVVPPPLEKLKGTTADACKLCNLPFEFLAHRQHCRNCGKIFCSNCAAKQIVIPWMKQYTPVPACNTCHRKIRADERLRHMNLDS